MLSMPGRYAPSLFPSLFRSFWEGSLGRSFLFRFNIGLGRHARSLFPFLSRSFWEGTLGRSFLSGFDIELGRHAGRSFLFGSDIKLRRRTGSFLPSIVLFILGRHGDHSFPNLFYLSICGRNSWLPLPRPI